MKNQPPPSRPLQPRPDAAVARSAPAAGAGKAPYTGVDIFAPFRLDAPKVLKRPARPAQVVQQTRDEVSAMYERGVTSAAMSFHASALEIMEEVVVQAPDHANGWKSLAWLLRLAGRDTEADAADARHKALAGVVTAWHDAQGERSATRLELLDRKLKAKLEKTPDEKRLTYLRDVLFDDPLDVAAMRYLAHEEDVADDPLTSINLLERAIGLSPHYFYARLDYAKMLMDQRHHEAALKQSEYLLANAPQSFEHRQLRADAAKQMERLDEAVALFEGLLKEQPNNLQALNSYGALLKNLGRRDDSVKAYRKMLSVAPGNGNAYFGLSELKSNYLTTADIVAMHSFLTNGVAELSSRKGMAYALGAALERAKDYKGSFEAYAYGAEVCREEVASTFKAHDPEKFEERLDRVRRAFTAESMAERMVPPPASPATTPIFVLGMPRAGSTLTEQILASHSLVEGTRELPVVADLTKKIAMSRLLVNPDVYPARVLDFDRAQLDALGEDCIRGIAEFRSTTRPFVIDKRPWNWIDAPFLHLILPQAKFIDIRRAPMSAGFAMFKQLLPRDAAFSYDLRHAGHYYRTYVDYMNYLDTIMPGRILRVSYEDLVNDTEAQIRRMLDYCGLPFEERCLRFWETDRAVITPSAEQVRRPIFRDAMEQWKNYEPWLGPLKEALGDLAGP